MYRHAQFEIYKDFFLTQYNSDTHNIRTFKIDSTYNRYDLIIIGWRTTYIAKVWFVCFFDACMYHVCIYIIFVGIYSRPRTSCTVLAFFNLYSRLLYCIHYSIRSIERNFSLLYIYNIFHGSDHISDGWMDTYACVCVVTVLLYYHIYLIFWWKARQLFFLRGKSKSAS